MDVRKWFVVILSRLSSEDREFLALPPQGDTLPWERKMTYEAEQMTSDVVFIATAPDTDRFRALLAGRLVAAWQSAAVKDEVIRHLVEACILAEELRVARLTEK